jgi:hypothetical protein
MDNETPKLLTFKPRPNNEPGVHTHTTEVEARRREDNERLVRWTLPLIKKGYRFKELTQVRQELPEYAGLTRLVGLGITAERGRLVLWLRRQWRKLVPYGCQDIVVGGEWCIWRRYGRVR